MSGDGAQKFGKLEHCPFCGCSIVELRLTYDCVSSCGVGAVCHGCGASSACMPVDNPQSRQCVQEAEDAATEAWNRRLEITVRSSNLVVR